MEPERDLFILVECYLALLQFLFCYLSPVCKTAEVSTETESLYLGEEKRWDSRELVRTKKTG